MTRWLALMIGLGLAPSAAQAMDSYRGPPAQVEQPNSPRVNFRIIQDNLYGARSTRWSGMIASTEVAPRTIVGVGIIKAPSRRSNTPDWRIDSRASASRRAALTVQFRF